MLNLDYNSIQCFNRLKSQSKALFTIPIETIKSVETVVKNIPKNNSKSNVRGASAILNNSGSSSNSKKN